MASADEDTVRRFYEAFQRRDADAMVACYAPDVRFSDPVFEDLRGGRARAMWRMLCERGKDLEIVFSDVRAGDAGPDTARAHWEARYTFSLTKRRVHNVIDATFELSAGRIVRHVDRFDLWRWTRHALGPAGVALGWSPLVRGPLRRKALAGLDEFIAARGDAATRP